MGFWFLPNQTQNPYIHFFGCECMERAFNLNNSSKSDDCVISLGELNTDIKIKVANKAQASGFLSKFNNFFNKFNVVKCSKKINNLA